MEYSIIAIIIISFLAGSSTTYIIGWAAKERKETLIIKKETELIKLEVEREKEMLKFGEEIGFIDSEFLDLMKYKPEKSIDEIIDEGLKKEREIRTELQIHGAIIGYRCGHCGIRFENKVNHLCGDIFRTSNHNWIPMY
jgi:hypothetical protein